jgi:hypothetical protein
MILKYGTLSLFGAVSAITVSSSSASLSMILKAILVIWFLFIAMSHLLRAFHDSELNRNMINNIVVSAVYLGLVVSAPRVIDRLSSANKDLLIAIGAALLIFMFVEKSVESYARIVNEPLFRIAQFVSCKISKILPKKAGDIYEQDEQLKAADFRVSAIHESGHALLYGVLDYVPESLTVYVNKRVHSLSDSREMMIGGRVFAEAQARPHQYQSFVEWSMLLSLAGQEGEKILSGQSSMGARSDMDHWYCLAKLYLGSGCSKLLYFPAPESNWEERANRKSLEIMLDKQRKILSRFFGENLQVLKDLADTLNQRECLKAADLKPFLEKVVRTPGIPSVLKEYSPHI